MIPYQDKRKIDDELWISNPQGNSIHGICITRIFIQHFKNLYKNLEKDHFSTHLEIFLST